MPHDHHHGGGYRRRGWGPWWVGPPVYVVAAPDAAARHAARLLAVPVERDAWLAALGTDCANLRRAARQDPARLRAAIGGLLTQAAVRTGVPAALTPAQLVAALDAACAPALAPAGEITPADSAGMGVGLALLFGVGGLAWYLHETNRGQRRGRRLLPRRRRDETGRPGPR